MIRITFVKEFSSNIEQLTIKNGYFVSKLSFNQLKQVGPSVVVPKNQSKCMALTRPADNIGENSLPPPFLNLSFQLSSFFLYLILFINFRSVRALCFPTFKEGPLTSCPPQPSKKTAKNIRA